MPVKRDPRIDRTSDRARARPEFSSRIPLAILFGADLVALASLSLYTGSDSLLVNGYLGGVVAWLAATGGYQVPLPPLWLESMPRLIRTTSLPSVLFLIASGSFGVDVSPAALVGTTVLVLGFSRLSSIQVIRAARSRGRLRSRVVVVGGGRVGERIIEALRVRPEHGLDVVGYVDDDARPDVAGVHLGRVADLDEVMARTGAATVIVTFLRSSDSTIVEQLRDAAARGVDVLVVPRMFDVSHRGSTGGGDHIWGVHVVRLGRQPTGGFRWRAKRLFDVIASATGLLFLSPLLLVLAVAVRASSPGPVLFRQRRVGQNGRCFELLKFRSMAVNDDSDTTWTVGEDRRVTRIGRLMRRYSLDELPQLLNVLMGDMSLVGPRPERPTFVDSFRETIPSYAARHRVPVGLTGWAQVNGLRGDTSIEERARFDNSYVEAWSLWRDITILLRTAVAVLRHPG